MDERSVQGKGEKLVGGVKEVAGKATGDRELEAEGAGDKAKGSVHDAVGAVKDAAKDVAAKVRTGR